MPQMNGWAGRARVVLILLALAATIVAPVVVSGYVDLRRADGFQRKGLSWLAAQNYESAAKKLPWEPQLWDLAAFSYADALKWDNAMPLFRLGKKLGVLSSRSWVQYGLGYYYRGQILEAASIWREGLQHYPKEATFYYYFAGMDRYNNDFAAEARDLGVWVTEGKPTEEDLYELGKLLMASDPGRARSEFKQVVAIDPDSSSWMQTLNSSLDLANLEASPSRRLVIIGRAVGLVNDWPLAKYDFQQAVDADPKNAEAWAWLGEAQQQNKVDGKTALDKALELDPNSPLVHGLRALYWKRQGKYKAELAEYQEAASLEPKNADWQVALGDAYTSTGDLVSALAAYVSATSLAPDNATYWRLLALFSADNGVQVLDVGLPAAKKAAEIAPDDPQVLDALGWTCAQAGLLTTAEQTLNKAIKVSPDSASAHLHLAETFLRGGNTASALAELRKVVELDPNGPSGAYADQLLKQYFP